MTTTSSATRTQRGRVRIENRPPVDPPRGPSSESTRDRSTTPPRAPESEATTRPTPQRASEQRTRNQEETNLANQRAWRLQWASADVLSASSPAPNLASAGRDFLRAVHRRLPAPVQDATRNMGVAVRDPGGALDAALKAPMMTERLTRGGDAQMFEIDAELKASVSAGVASAGLKGKAGGTLTIERRDDGDFDVSLRHSATLTKTGDRKKSGGPVSESKLGWEGGARVSVTETYTTSATNVEDRAADLVRDRMGDLNALTGGSVGRLADQLLDPSDADKAALSADWSKTRVEGGGFFRGQLSAKYGKLFGVETTARDDWVQSGAVEISKDGDVSLTLKLDNDVSLKNGVFAKVKGVEGKLQELSDIEGSETTLTMTWKGAAKGRDPFQVAQAVLDGGWQGPDSVRLRNRVQEHDLIEKGGAKVTFDGTHAPYTETTTDATFDTRGANPHELAALFQGDKAQARQFNPVARQTIERFSYEGPDLDLKPELKLPKVLKGVGDLSAALEVETGIRKRDTLIERNLNPATAVEQIRSNTLSPLLSPLPTTLGDPNSTPAPYADATKPPGVVVETLEEIEKVVVGAPIVLARRGKDLVDDTLQSVDEAAESLTERAFETLGGDKWDKLSDAERAYVVENPRLAVAFNQAADRADEVAVERGFEKNGSDRGIFGDAGGNAYRHALWNALMVREAFKQDVRMGVSRSDKLGEAAREAKMMADAHEDNPKNTIATNKQMDLRNNDVGRQIAIEVLKANRWASEAQIASAVERALQDGRLTRVSGQSLAPATDPR